MFFLIAALIPMLLLHAQEELAPGPPVTATVTQRRIQGDFDKWYRRHLVPDKARLARALTVPVHPPESHEEKVVTEGLRRAYRRYFRGDAGHLEGIGTTEFAGDDVLVARFANCIAFDDPIHVSFFFPAAAREWEDAVRTRRFFEEIVRREVEDPSKQIAYAIRPPLRGISVWIAGSEGFGAFDGGMAARQMATGEEHWISLWQDQGSAWAAISLLRLEAGAGETTDELTGIAERFPPLRQRVRSWPMARLYSELGPYRESGPASSIPRTKRDRVLLKELLGRDLRPADVSALLALPWPNTVLVEEIVSARQTLRFEEPLREYLAHLLRNRKTRFAHDPFSPAASRVINALARDGSLDVTDLLIQYWTEWQGEAGSGFHSYVAERSSRTADYQRLRALAGEEEETWWLRRIRERLGAQ